MPIIFDDRKHLLARHRAARSRLLRMTADFGATRTIAKPFKAAELLALFNSVSMRGRADRGVEGRTARPRRRVSEWGAGPTCAHLAELDAEASDPTCHRIFDAIKRL